MGAGRLGIRLAESGAHATGRALRLVWPVRRPARPEHGFLCLTDRIALLRATVPNWPLLALDMIAARGTELTYRTARGHRILCRARTSDLLETVIVSSGFEYPLEPMAENFALLCRNLRINQVTGFTAVNAAVSSAAGEGFLRTRGQPDTAYLDPSAGDGELVRTVELGRLCDAMGIGTVSLLKMDIEGGEHEVLAASWPFIAERVKVLVLEFHEDGPDRDLESLRRLLEPAFTIAVLHRGPNQGVLIARENRDR